MKNVKLSVEYSAHKSSWMDKKIFTDWFTNIFIPVVKADHEEGKKYLLLVDNAPSHLEEEILNKTDPVVSVNFLHYRNHSTQ